MWKQVHLFVLGNTFVLHFIIALFKLWLVTIMARHEGCCILFVFYMQETPDLVWKMLIWCLPSCVQDLVAWVTVGFLHVPHAEDIPNTATPGNSVGFFLRPFNFFDEDPSVASKNTIIVRQEKDSTPKVQRWMPEVVGHCVTSKPFFYDGTYVDV